MPHSVTRPPQSNTARWARVTLASLLSHTLGDDPTDKIITRSQRTGGVSSSPNQTVDHHCAFTPSLLAFHGYFRETCHLKEYLSCAIMVAGCQFLLPRKTKKPQILASPVKGRGRNQRSLWAAFHVLYSLCGCPKHEYVPMTHIPNRHCCVAPPCVTAAFAGQVTIDKEVCSQQPGWTGMSSLTLWGGWGKVTFFFGIRKWRREPAVAEILLCSHLHPRREFFHLCQRRETPLTWLIPMASYMSQCCRCQQEERYIGVWLIRGFPAGSIFLQSVDHSTMYSLLKVLKLHKETKC